jgi:IS5 family transposase
MKLGKTQAPRGFFDEQEALEKLSKLKDPLEKLSSHIDFEIFRPTLEVIYTKPEPKSSAGAKPFDYLLMFKILILQRLYNLSDEQMEYQLVDRLSFKRFTGLEFSHRVPDCNTIWNFKQGLAKDSNEKKMFDLFYKIVEEKKLIVNEGKMVDASFHEAPRQRNSRDENKEIKEGKTPEAWQSNKNKHKLAHKDLDARWTKKHNDTYYGYKNHIKADTGSKLIDNYEVTDASVHDSQPLGNLLDEKDKGQTLHADSAYTGEEIEGMVSELEMINQIHEKGYKNKPLTVDQKEKNRTKSTKRARVEHIFGFIETSMKGTYIRTIGMARAKANIGITNLTYNICRAVQLGINMFSGDNSVQTVKSNGY